MIEPSFDPSSPFDTGISVTSADTNPSTTPASLSPLSFTKYSTPNNLLTEGNIMVSNNVVTFHARLTRTYQPGIKWSGVGITFYGNEVAYGPAQGGFGTGQFITIAGNYFHDLVTEETPGGN